MKMEATVIKIGASLGLKVPEAMIKDLYLKVGTKIDLNYFIQDGKLVILQEKSKVRGGWDAAFAKYALEGEDKQMLPDFLDSEIDAFL